MADSYTTDVSDEPAVAGGFQEVIAIEEQHDSAAGGMPQLNPDSFASQLFWLIITFGALYLLMSTHLIPRIKHVLEKRQNQLTHDLDTAERAKEEAGKIQAAYEKEVAAARQKANDKINQTSEMIREQAAKAHGELDAKLAREMAAAEQSIATQCEQAKADMQPVVTELSSLIVEKISTVRPDDSAVNRAVSKQMDERS